MWNDSEEIKFLHTNKFDIDEQAIPFGIAVMTMVVVKYLLENNANLVNQLIYPVSLAYLYYLTECKSSRSSYWQRLPRIDCISILFKPCNLIERYLY